jgi:membrane associated rhomboid family serine protease
MIPIRDNAPKFSTPYITYFLLVLNLAVFLFELSLEPRSRAVFLYQFGLVPAELTGLVPGEALGPAAVLTIFTSMFLHASWLHLIFNMWALWIFGDNAEDYLGRFRFLGLYFGAGVAAALLHTAFHPDSTIPTVGASGAIGGVMGAYFVLYPTARVLTVIPLLFYWPLVWLPAWLVLGYWFVAQFLSGAATTIADPAQASGGGVAFWAHVGGFVAGAALIKLFPSRPRRYRYGNW